MRKGKGSFVREKGVRRRFYVIKSEADVSIDISVLWVSAARPLDISTSHQTSLTSCRNFLQKLSGVKPVKKKSMPVLMTNIGKSLHSNLISQPR